MLMMGWQKSTKTSPVNFKHQSLSINVFDPMYSPSITTENYTVRKKRLVGNIGKILKAAKKILQSMIVFRVWRQRAWE
jgi:hypothetical protein